MCAHVCNFEILHKSNNKLTIFMNRLKKQNKHILTDIYDSHLMPSSSIRSIIFST